MEPTPPASPPPQPIKSVVPLVCHTGKWRSQTWTMEIQGREAVLYMQSGKEVSRFRRPAEIANIQLPSFVKSIKLLTIKAAHLEPRERANESNARAMASAVRDYLRFLGGGDVVLGQSTPAELGPLLHAAFHEAAG